MGRYYNWKRLYAEEVEAPDFGKMSIQDVEPSGDENQDFENAMEALRDDNYEAFVADLNTLAKDSKIAFLRDVIIDKFNNEKGFTVHFSRPIAMPIKNIHPTQFEVDMEKSLSYPLSKAPNTIHVAYSGKPVVIAKTPLVVAEVDGVYYIIDGHHRWSQIYCLNPDAQMMVRILKSQDLFKSADDVLKLVQMQLFIAKDGGKLPQATVDSAYNLYTIDESAFKKWCWRTMTDEAVAAFKPIMFGQKKPEQASESNKGDNDLKRRIVAKLWNNVLTMRNQAAPTKNAHGRGDMPQTDKVSGEYIKPKAAKVS